MLTTAHRGHRQKTGDVADHIYVSPDNGVTWDEITRPGQRFANAEAVAVDPYRPGTIWISTGGRSVARFTPAPALQLTSAVSRKLHNGVPFDIDLPLTGNSGVECRNSGGTDTIVFTFTNDIASGRASVTSGSGVTGTPSFAATTMTVPLSGVADVQKITVSVSGVMDTFTQSLPSASVQMRKLIADSNGDGTVNSGDALQSRNRSGQDASAANFRSDLNADGTINSGDALVVRARSGNQVAP